MSHSDCMSWDRGYVPNCPSCGERLCHGDYGWAIECLCCGWVKFKRQPPSKIGIEEKHLLDKYQAAPIGLV